MNRIVILCYHLINSWNLFNFYKNYKLFVNLKKLKILDFEKFKSIPVRFKNLDN